MIKSKCYSCGRDRWHRTSPSDPCRRCRKRRGLEATKRLRPQRRPSKTERKKHKKGGKQK